MTGPPRSFTMLPVACSICADPTKSDFVARRHLEGHSLTKMETLSRERGTPIKRETIQKHLQTCLAVPEGMTPSAVAAQAEKMSATDPSEDVAVLVQRQVIAKLQAGEARVTVQHGLQAQTLLDRRAERAKDRELAITLARLLHAQVPPASVVLVRPEPDVIEDAEYVEVG